MTALCIGLTGGIGSGKTTVADRFGALGVTLVDTDLIAHGLTGPDGGAPALSLGLSRDSAERGRLFVTTRGMLGSALLVFEMERIP